MVDRKRDVLRLGGRSLARLIQFVARTSKVSYEPADLPSRLRATHPCIVACWHGQFMMLNLLHPGDVKVSAMVARHGDAELIGEAMRVLNTSLIRGAGAGGRKKDRGGASALRESVRTLTGGSSLVMTADVPPGPARIAGDGIITIARLSGCPIVPVAAASSRFKSFDTWSRLTINLPYSKLVFAAGDPIAVPRNADPETLEALRLTLERSLNAATTRAYVLAGGDEDRATPHHLLSARNPPAPGLRLRAYRAALTAFQPAVPLILGARERRGKEDPTRRSERLGTSGLSRPNGPLVWIHAASVGETNAVLPLIDRLLAADRELSILLTTGTVTSAALAKNRLPARAMHQFVPLDVVKYIARFLDHWRPDLGVFTESEIWPNLILESSRRKVPLALVNARMSPRSMKRWKRHARLARPLFSRFSVVLTQNDKIARTITLLGAPNVQAVGNLKIDSPAPHVEPASLLELQRAVGDRPLLVAASTHPGEEEIIADAHRILAKALPGFLTIIVPRHPPRAPQIQRSLSAQNFTTALRSVSGAPGAEIDIYIADTIGELGTFYAMAPLAFIGGSLVSHGGQNPIEAIRHDAIVLTGPAMHNFRDAYGELLRAAGAFEIADAKSLAATVVRLMADPASMNEARRNAAEALSGMSGALEKTLEALRPYVRDGSKDTARAD